MIFFDGKKRMKMRKRDTPIIYIRERGHADTEGTALFSDEPDSDAFND